MVDPASATTVAWFTLQAIRIWAEERSVALQGKRSSVRELVTSLVTMEATLYEHRRELTDDDVAKIQAKIVKTRKNLAICESIFTRSTTAGRLADTSKLDRTEVLHISELSAKTAAAYKEALAQAAARTASSQAASSPAVTIVQRFADGVQNIVEIGVLPKNMNVTVEVPSGDAAGTLTVKVARRGPDSESHAIVTTRDVEAAMFDEAPINLGGAHAPTPIETQASDTDASRERVLAEVFELAGAVADVVEQASVEDSNDFLDVI
ncbi:unnamed protein product [Peniophora sp. CBMAI 1063]|nr:unnamed protein product [Peniophora sp. CBMAI 1063]